VVSPSQHLRNDAVCLIARWLIFLEDNPNTCSWCDLVDSRDVAVRSRCVVMGASVTTWAAAPTPAIGSWSAWLVIASSRLAVARSIEHHARGQRVRGGQPDVLIMILCGGMICAPESVHLDGSTALFTPPKDACRPITSVINTLTWIAYCNLVY
jgi:hypothetical protein